MAQRGVLLAKYTPKFAGCFYTRGNAILNFYG